MVLLRRFLIPLFIFLLFPFSLTQGIHVIGSYQDFFASAPTIPSSVYPAERILFLKDGKSIVAFGFAPDLVRCVCLTFELNILWSKNIKLGTDTTLIVPSVYGITEDTFRNPSLIIFAGIMGNTDRSFLFSLTSLDGSPAFKALYKSDPNGIIQILPIVNSNQYFLLAKDNYVAIYTIDSGDYSSIHKIHSFSDIEEVYNAYYDSDNYLVLFARNNNDKSVFLRLSNNMASLMNSRTLTEYTSYGTDSVYNKQLKYFYVLYNKETPNFVCAFDYNFKPISSPNVHFDFTEKEVVNSITYEPNDNYLGAFGKKTKGEPYATLLIDDNLNQVTTIEDKLNLTKVELVRSSLWYEKYMFLILALSHESEGDRVIVINIAYKYYTACNDPELPVKFYGGGCRKSKPDLNCYPTCATCWEDNTIYACSSAKPEYYYILYTSLCKVNKVFRPSTMKCEDIIFENCDKSCLGQCYKSNSKEDCIDLCGFTFYYNLNSYSCQPCINGCKICFDSSSCSQCLDTMRKYQGLCVKYCPDGFYDADGIECKQCMAFCAKCGNENTCSSCEPGKYLMKYEGGNPDSCIDDCPDGYAKDTGNVCSKCPANCIKCLIPSECVTCAAGFLVSLATKSCVANCGQGKYIDSSSNCLNCPAGTYSNTYDASSCTQCLKGTYSAIEGMISCTLCEIGTASNILGANDEKVCAKCPGGYYSDSKGLAECKVCSLGSYSESEGASSCKKCIEGTYNDVSASKSSTDCKNCPLGEYSENQGSSACTKCNPGYYNGVEGRTSCSKCPKGTYRALPGATSSEECTKCPEGSYNDIAAQSICKNCPLGTYGDNKGLLSCISCPRGSYCNSEGASSFNKCKIGTANPLPEAKSIDSCVKCSEGTYNDVEGRESCTPCPKGTYCELTGANSLSDCQKCALGTFNFESGKASCQKCDFGSKGIYDINGMANCILCEPGFYNDAPGKAICIPCPKGTYNNIPGSKYLSNCLPCKEGFYNDDTAQNKCTPCPVGTFNPNTGRDSLDNCIKCNKGYYNQYTGSKVCSACPKGTYLDIEGGTSINSCKLCPINTYSNTEARTNQCLDCPAGAFTITPGQEICQHCSLYCQSCTSSISCDQCSPGYYKIIDPSTQTNKCDSTCQVRFYPDKAKMTCVMCDFRCLACNSGSNTDCTVCDNSIEGVIKSPDGNGCECIKGRSPNFLLKRCEKCNSELCGACNPLNIAECYLCNPSIEHTIYDYTAKSCNCMVGYTNVGPSCQPCHPLCKSCTGVTNKDCEPKQCQNGAYFLETNFKTCILMCDSKIDRMYLDPAEKMCRLCKRPCDKCFGGDSHSCLSCLSTYVLHQSECVSQCPRKLFNQDGVCVPCSPKCVNCENKMSYCVDGCEFPYVQLNNDCLVECPKFYTLNNNRQCLRCEPDAEACYWDNNLMKVVTKACKDKMKLFNDICVITCPPGMYSEEGVCSSCDKSCASCFGPSDHQCLDCNKNLGYVLASENYCNFPTCISGMFFSVSSLSCINKYYLGCPIGCSLCKNSKYCEACSPGYELSVSTHICVDACDKDGFRKKENSIECEEICGDGKNMHLLECDDGNTKNGDGCSANCYIEEFFECSGGDETHPDKCRKTLKPRIESFTYYGNKTALLKFSERIKIKSQNIEDCISFAITGQEETAQKISVSWNYSKTRINKNDFKYLPIDLDFNGSLSGREYLTFRLKKVTCLEDIYGNQLDENIKNTKVKKYLYLSSSEKAAADASGKASVLSVIPSMVLSLGLSLAFNTPLEGMWAIINVIQMLSYITLMQLEFPENVLIFFGQIESVHNYNKWLPNVFSLILETNKFNDEAYNDSFERRGFNSCIMLILAGSDFIVLAVMVISVAVLAILKRAASIFDKVQQKLKYSSILRSLIQSYLKLCLAAFVNINVYSFSSLPTALASITAIAIACSVIALPAFLSEFLYRYYPRISGDEDFQKKFSTLIDGLKWNNLMAVMYYPIFLFRRVTFAAVLVALAKYPVIQLGLQLLCSIVYIYYLKSYKPFKDKYTYYSALNAECLMLFSTITFFAFLSDNSYCNIVGWTIIGATLSSLIGSWLLMFKQHYDTWKAAKAATRNAEVSLKIKSAKNKTSKRAPNKKEQKELSDNSVLNKINQQRKRTESIQELVTPDAILFLRLPNNMPHTLKK